MGQVKQLLAEKTFNPSDCSVSNRGVVELCECIHLHWGNVRLEFDPATFQKFVTLVLTASCALTTIPSDDWGKYDENSVTLSAIAIEPSERRDVDKAKLELNEDGSFHLHIGDVRFEGGMDGAPLVVNAMVRHVVPYRFALLSLNDIDPFDASHFEDGDYWKGKDSEDTADHRRGVETVKVFVSQGKRIRPILVTPLGENKYKRLDGFKRYMAAKELGRTQIACLVTPNAQAGGAQQGQPFIIEEDEWKDLQQSSQK